MNYCLITDRKLYQESLVDVAKAAEASGVDYFQLREKDLPLRDLLHLAKEIRRYLKKTIFIVNGLLEVALASKADGVHLQKGNLPVDAVRSNYPDLQIGYSAHSYEEMRDAERRGASYLFISPIFEPRSKSPTLPPLGAEVAGKWTQSVEIPVFALGGIAAENLTSLDSAGIKAVAGISFFVRDGKFTNEWMVL